MSWLVRRAVGRGRDRVVTQVLICLPLMLLACRERPADLEPGEEVEGELAAQETVELRLFVGASRFVELTATPVGTTGPARTLRVDVTGPGPRTVAEGVAVAAVAGDRFVWLSDSGGEYRLRLSATEPLLPASYRLRLEARDARQGDAWRLGALRAESEAARRASRQDLDSAIAELQHVRRYWQLAEEHEAEVSALFDLADLEEELQRAESAFLRYDEAARVANEIGNRGLVAEAMLRRGRLLARLDEMDRAEEAYQEARTVAEQAGDGPRVATIAFNEGMLLLRRGDLDGAWEVLVEAEDLARSADDPLTEAYSLLARSKILRARFEIGAALELALEALEISSRSGSEHPAQAAISHELGNLHRQQGDLAGALADYEASARLFRAEGDWPGVADSLRSLSVLAQAMRDSREARRYAEEALELAEALADPARIAECQRELGAVLAWRGEIPEAEALYLRALDSLPQGDDRLRGSILHRLGVLDLTRGRIERAVERLQQAAELRQRVNDRDGLALTRLKLGVALTEAGRLDEARIKLSEGLDYYRRRESPDQIAICQYYLARVELAAGRLEAARNAIEETLALGRDLRAQLTTDAMRIEFFSRVRPFYDFYVDLLMRLAASHPGGGYEELAFRASEEARARGLLDLLFDADADLRRGIDPELEQRGREIERRLTFLQSQLSNALSRDAASRRSAHLRALYEATEEEWTQVERRLQGLSPSYRQVRTAQPLELAEVQRLLGPQRALIEYWLGERRSFVFAVSEAALEVRELPPRAEIQARVSAFRDGIRAILPPESLAPDAHWLSDRLLTPVEDTIRDRARWIVVPDGPLQTMPFEALPVAPEAGREGYLVESRAISYAPSATVLALLVRDTESRSADEGPRFVVFADPDFDRDAVVPCPGNDGSEENRVLGLAATAGAISASRSEAQELVALHGARASRAFLGRAATEAAAKSDPEIRSATQVHFATHGLICESRPERSALVLAGTTDSEDGLLQLREVFDLHLSADLVVLSACDTGLGRNMEGEGIVGLARGFLYAGAASVVVSLWQVADRSTAELMVDFYRELENGGSGADKAEALRTAKRAMIARGGARAHPFYWAPFILIGARESAAAV